MSDFTSSLGAGIVGLGAGVTAMVMSKNIKEQNEKEAKYNKVKSRKEKYIEDRQNEEWLNQVNDDTQGKKSKRHVQLEFDSDDNCIEKEYSDKDDDENEVKDEKDTQIRSRVTYNIGDEAYNVTGKTIITDDIFEPAPKETNAAIFIENWKKVKATHELEQQREILQLNTLDSKDSKRQTEAEGSRDNELYTQMEKEQQYSDEQQIKEGQKKKIMDIDPKRMNGKDHMFMDFVSMYGKAFINSKKDHKSQKQGSESRKKKQQQQQNKPGGDAFRQLMQSMAQGKMQ